MKSILVATFLCLAQINSVASSEIPVKSNSLVYIECSQTDAEGIIHTVRGSGVAIGSDGRILTAKHVGQFGECLGAVGGGQVPNLILQRGPISSQYDAMILRLVSPTIDVSPIGYVASKKAMSIAAIGVPVDSNGREFNVAFGRVMNAVPDNDGFVRTDALTARGMSGGPVIDTDTGGAVGIIAGASFDQATGAITGYRVLTIENFAVELGIASHQDILAEIIRLESGFVPPRLTYTSADTLDSKDPCYPELNPEKVVIRMPVSVEYDPSQFVDEWFFEEYIPTISINEDADQKAQTSLSRWFRETGKLAKIDLEKNAAIYDFCIVVDRGVTSLPQLSMRISDRVETIDVIGLPELSDPKTQAIISSVAEVRRQAAPDWVIPRTTRFTSNMNGEAVLELEFMNPLDRPSRPIGLDIEFYRASGVSCMFSTPGESVQLYLDVGSDFESIAESGVYLSTESKPEPIRTKAIFKEEGCGNKSLSVSLPSLKPLEPLSTTTTRYTFYDFDKKAAAFASAGAGRLGRNSQLFGMKASMTVQFSNERVIPNRKRASN